jgi:hypothetical protein
MDREGHFVVKLKRDIGKRDAKSGVEWYDCRRLMLQCDLTIDLPGNEAFRRVCAAYFSSIEHRGPEDWGACGALRKL